jgi:hypothetical protein
VERRGARFHLVRVVRGVPPSLGPFDRPSINVRRTLATLDLLPSRSRYTVLPVESEIPERHRRFPNALDIHESGRIQRLTIGGHLSVRVRMVIARYHDALGMVESSE